MLTKENRLKKDKEFRKVFRFSRPAASGRLTLRMLETKSKTTRFGFVISNKIDKRATRRNSLKRRLRALVRELISRVKPGYDVVVIVKENYPFPYDYALIKKDLTFGLEKLGVIR